MGFIKGFCVRRFYIFYVIWFVIVLGSYYFLIIVVEIVFEVYVSIK